MMPNLIVQCPNERCRARFEVDDMYLGRKARCKNCQTTFVLTQPPGEPEPSSPGSATPKVAARCPKAGCGAETQVPDAMLARTVRCKRCGTTFVLTRSPEVPGAASSRRPEHDGGAAPAAEDGVPRVWSPG